MERFAIEALGVTKQYGGRDAVRDVDLVTRPGSLHGLLGPNGAGKTTLLRILLGLVRSDAGTVRLLGHGLDGASGPIPESVAGFVETPAFYPYLSGRRNLELLARLDGSRLPAMDLIEDVIDQVDLAAHANARVAGYSAGMRQRLGIAAALLRSPRLLLLDEPTSALDPAGALRLRSLFQRLAASGAAVVLSSHDMTEVEGLCDMLTVIDHGRVIFSGTLDELRICAPDPGYVLQTSDNRVAVDLSSEHADVTITACTEGLEVSASEAALDAYVIALGRKGVAVRSLERRERSLESLFLQLTGNKGESSPSLPS